jgi:hypothetical protein
MDKFVYSPAKTDTSAMNSAQAKVAMLSDFARTGIADLIAMLQEMGATVDAPATMPMGDLLVHVNGVCVRFTAEAEHKAGGVYYRGPFTGRSVLVWDVDDYRFTSTAQNPFRKHRCATTPDKGFAIKDYATKLLSEVERWQGLYNEQERRRNNAKSNATVAERLEKEFNPNWKHSGLHIQSTDRAGLVRIEFKFSMDEEQARALLEALKAQGYAG